MTDEPYHYHIHIGELYKYLITLVSFMASVFFFVATLYLAVRI